MRWANRSFSSLERKFTNSILFLLTRESFVNILLTMITRYQAKVTLKKRGWSQRAAAKELGRSFPHLNYVLNGKRQSRTLLKQVMSLPPREHTTGGKG